MQTTRRVVRYIPGVAGIIFGVLAALYWLMLIPMSEVVIADTVGFAQAEGLEKAGQLGPWRPATADDLEGEQRIILPVERYIVREGHVNAFLHHIRLMVARDKAGEIRVDTVIHLDPQWRVGWAIFVVLATTLGPISLGCFWMWAIGRLYKRSRSGNPQSGGVESAGERAAL